MFLFKNTKNKPYYLVNGVLTQNHPFNNFLWDSYIAHFKGIEDGIDRSAFDRIVAEEQLDRCRQIVFSERNMTGYSWTVAVFPCEISVSGVVKKMFAVTGTGERGTEGDRAYFEEENYALAFLIAHLRSMTKDS